MNLSQRISLLAGNAFLLLMVACGSSTPPIVFTSDRDGNLEIYTVSPDGGEQKNLTKSPQPEHSPRLSPNARHVAFLADEGSDQSVEVIRINGKDRTKVSEDGGNHEDVQWSPRNNRLAYVRSTPSSSHVYVSHSDGIEKMLLTKIEAQHVGGWSPRGDSVVFGVRSGPHIGLYTRNPDGVNEFRLTDQNDLDAVWSPTGDKIAFVSLRDGAPELYVMNSEGGKATRVTQSASLVSDIDWAPDGRRIAFASDRDGNSEIYVITVGADNELEELSRLTHNDVIDESPAWSPNGKKIAFVSHLDGDSELFVMDANGDKQRRLTNNSDSDFAPSW